MSDKSNTSDSLIDIRYILIVWLKWGWLALLLAPIGAYIGYRDLQGFVPVYEAKLLVQPSSQNTPQLSVTSSIFGGLGIGAAQSSSEFDRLTVLMRSRSLAQRLQDKYSLMQVVYESSWDSNKEEWIKPEGEDFERQERINALLKKNKWSAPNLESLSSFLGSSIDFSVVPGTSFYKVSFSHPDPEFALEIMQIAYSEADSLLRDQDRVEATKRREYIEGQLKRPAIVDIQQALIDLMKSEQRRAMLLESDLPYAARIIEPAMVSSLPNEPNVQRIIGFPIFISVLLGFIFITLISVLRRE